MMGGKLEPCRWAVGDSVMRKPGASYMFPGVIISIGLKLDGKTWHCEVECIAPGVEGCTHVFPASHLVALPKGWEATTITDLQRKLAVAREALEAIGQCDVSMNGNIARTALKEIDQ